MRITQLMLAKGFGGAERSFVDLCRALAENGHDVQAIFHPRFSEAQRLTACAAIQSTCVNVRGNWDFPAGWQIAAKIREFGPAIIQAHLARGAYFGGAAGRKLRIPVIVKTHNYVDLKYYRHVDYLVTTTADQRDYLLAHGVASERIEVIPNFSSLKPYARTVQPDYGSLRVLSFGRMVKKKGFDVLLRAFATFIDQGHTATLTLGGDGPERSALEHLATALGIESHVVFSGWVDDVGSALRNADVFVLPSLDEPFGIAVLEAMAHDLPIIATRTKGPLEILDAATGYLVPIGDAATLAEALVGIVAAPEDAVRRARAALDRFKSRYTREVVVPLYERLYQRALAPFG